MKFLSILICLCLHTALISQHTITGYVLDPAKNPIPGAMVQWLNSTRGTSTDADGMFTIIQLEEDHALVIQSAGNAPDTMHVEHGSTEIVFILEKSTQLEQVNIQAKALDQGMSAIQTRAVEMLSSDELKKAPCCTLAESFETTGSVDVGTENSVTGTREIELLGLRGTYIQLLEENRPAQDGIVQPYGLDLVPGTWVSGVNISKGASTVQNGNQGIAGQINYELVKPYLDKPIFVNLFTNHEGRKEANVHFNKKLSQSLSTGLLLHGSQHPKGHDANDDTFSDRPGSTGINAMNRWIYHGDKIEGQFSMQAMKYTKEGGQLHVHDHGQDSSQLYTTGQNIERQVVVLKTGVPQFGTSGWSLGLIQSYTHTAMDAHLGLNSYRGRENNYYANLLVQKVLPDPDHTLKGGVSVDYWNRDETINLYQKKYTIPGIWMEYDYAPIDADAPGWYHKIAVTGGVRLDRAPVSNKLLFTPRINIKWLATEDLVWRASMGKGYRIAQTYSQYFPYLASSRFFVFENTEFREEESINVGTNVNWNFHIREKEGTLSVDVYRTWFQNQIFGNLDFDPEVILYKQNKSSSKNYPAGTSTNILIRGEFNPYATLKLRLTWKWNTSTIYPISSTEKSTPYLPKYRGLAVIDWKLFNNKILLNTTHQYIGPQRLPASPGATLESYSPSYYLLNTQVTWIFKNWNIYAGTENTTSYTQPNPVLGFEDPWAGGFDATRVYAPVSGITYFLGLRWYLEGGK